MLNEQFFDKKDLQILKLKSVIDRFKKYDAERKAFLQKLQWELEDVSQQYKDLKDSLSDGDRYGKAQEKISQLKATVTGQNKAIERLKRQLSLVEDEELLKRAEEAVSKYTVAELKASNDKMRKEVERLRDDNKSLIVRILKLERQLDPRQPVS